MSQQGTSKKSLVGIFGIDVPERFAPPVPETKFQMGFFAVPITYLSTLVHVINAYSGLVPLVHPLSFHKAGIYQTVFVLASFYALSPYTIYILECEFPVTADIPIVKICLLIPTTVIIFVKSLKKMTLISAFATFLLASNAIICLSYYSITDPRACSDLNLWPLNRDESVFMFSSWTRICWPCGIVFYLQHQMKNPDAFTGFHGAFSRGFLISTGFAVFYTLSGLYRKAVGIVTTEIHHACLDEDPTEFVIRLIDMLILFMNYPLHFYAATNQLWLYWMQPAAAGSKFVHGATHYIVRVLLNFSIVLSSVLLPLLYIMIHGFISILVPFFGIILPAFLEMTYEIKIEQSRQARRTVVKDLFIIILGHSIMAINMYASAVGGLKIFNTL